MSKKDGCNKIQTKSDLQFSKAAKNFQLLVVDLPRHLDVSDHFPTIGDDEEAEVKIIRLQPKYNSRDRGLDTF